MDGPARRVVRGIVAVAALVATVGQPSRAGAQFDGRWSLNVPPLGPVMVTMTQAGANLSYSLFTSQFNGTVAGQSFSASTPPGGIFSNGAQMRGVLSSDPNRVVAALLNSANPPGFVPMQRCTCFDGNAINGDGCSNRCQVEPCYTCTGDPSVCTPAADGSPCEDGRVCTAGETCLAGACGGGSPVTPCVDLNGRWHLEFESELGSGSADRVVTQTGSYLEHSNCGGSIDPVTGSFDLACIQVDFQTFTDCPFGGRLGQASADGSSFGDTYSTYLFSIPEGCFEVNTSTSATRLCGDGDVEPGDECDDGNVAAGDGCDANCRIETCWTCTGDPSSCTPDGTRCGDGDDCTAGDSCQAGACVSGAALQCGACEGCGPLGCVAAPRPSCRQTTAPKRTMLSVRNSDGSARGDKIAWRWIAGEATAEYELADPLAGADYSLCVFDESQSPATLLARAGAAADDQCGAESCWEREAGGEIVYRNPDNDAGGLALVRMRPGADGEARILVRGKGPLQSPAPDALPEPSLPLPLLVQLQGEGGACFEARFGAAGVRVNDTRSFSARAVLPP